LETLGYPHAAGAQAGSGKLAGLMVLSVYHKIAFPLNPRIDYIFVSPRIAVDQARVLPRSAGDHFPVRAALKKRA
jgi:endonuclease/exonuclease/phosphatase family metal-dependent hydrolase